MARLWDSNRAFGGGYKLSSLCHDLLGWGKVRRLLWPVSHRPRARP
jgi:hypothetical protein